jgi:hypothetical protein
MDSWFYYRGKRHNQPAIVISIGLASIYYETENTEY